MDTVVVDSMALAHLHTKMRHFILNRIAKGRRNQFEYLQYTVRRHDMMFQDAYLVWAIFKNGCYFTLYCYFFFLKKRQLYH